MIAMLLVGIIILFFTVLHPWEKERNYEILAGICTGILLLEWLGITILDKMGKGEYINDKVTEGIIIFINIPGIIVGVIGVIICAVRKK
jgi:hypothetical protein